jgi:hypothetical protein
MGAKLFRMGSSSARMLFMLWYMLFHLCGADCSTLLAFLSQSFCSVVKTRVRTTLDR